MGKVKEAAAEQAANDETTKLALETLSGDVRDALLTHIRGMEYPWSKLSEAKQGDKIYAATSMATDLVRRVAHIVGANGLDHIGITIGKFTAADGTIKAQFETAQTHESLVKISDMQGRRSLLVLVDPDDYSGERTPAKPDKDQPDLDMAEAAE